MIAKELLTNVVSLGWVLVALVTCIGILALVNKGRISKLTVGAGKVRAEVDLHSLHSDIKEMKQAMEVITTEVKNGKPTTLVERVDRIESSQHAINSQLGWHGEVLEKIAHHIGFTPPDRVRTERTREEDKQGDT